MEWTKEKPKEAGLYFRCNPAFYKNVIMQEVYETSDSGLVTVHPMNEDAKLAKVEDMPNSFYWIKIPYPPHHSVKRNIKTPLF